MICVNISYRLFLERYAVLLQLTFHFYSPTHLPQWFFVTKWRFFLFIKFQNHISLRLSFSIYSVSFYHFIRFQALTNYSWQHSGLHIKVFRCYLIFWSHWVYVYNFGSICYGRHTVIKNKFNKVLCTASMLKSLGKLICFLNQMEILEAFHKVYFDVFSRLINSSFKCVKFKCIHEDAYNCWCITLPIWIFERLRLLLFVF